MCRFADLFAGDYLIGRMGGADRKHSGGLQAGGSTLAIVLGIVLDGFRVDRSRAVGRRGLSALLGFTVFDSASQERSRSSTVEKLVGVVTTLAFAISALM